MGSYEVAQGFVKNNLNKIKVMYSFLVMVSPECAIEAFNNGVKIDLLTEHWWSVSLYALRALNKTDKKKTKEILSENIIRVSEKINDITALDFDKGYFLGFLKLIRTIDTGIFDRIILELDIEKIENNWNRGTIYKGKEKQVENRRGQFYELIKR